MNLKSIREQLEQRLREYEARAEKTQRDASHRDTPVSADFAEQAIDRSNDDVLRAISGESSHEAALIRETLQRIEEGTYGACTQCGAEIGEQRLQAIPYATLCIRCAAAQE